GAKLLFKKLVAQHPRVPEVANLLALCELQLGEHEAAVEHAARACQLNMKEARYKNTLGTCLWLVGRSSEAIAAVEAALIDNPQLAEAKENLSQMMSHRIRMEATAATYAEALEIHPDSPQLLLKLAEIHALHGSIAQAK